MKRKFTLLALALLLVGAALWAVNARLNDPPPTKSDREFRASVAGADSVKIEQRNRLRAVNGIAPLTASRTLTPTQTRDLIGRLRFSDQKDSYDIQSITDLRLEFIGGNRTLAVYQLRGNGSSLHLVENKNQSAFYPLNARSTQKVRRWLDEVLPRRMRPLN